uniref:C59 Fab Light chain n=1 Tax=Oryctolagus cuniculus TaxID=9986 RepID=UPI002381D1BB|nr:Chain L, C59 Fab Light chain [Oryctolagus cuniculus]8DF1_N Chain N, C59 Fab Light chain [Oryctolagus cuniculus]8DF1_P Chain P, C59 Fab Light chain [Oryctolagus cuniculus]8DF1_R Chain R, C59 Fab Light chain [Oryctolagus cuniculus]8DF1_T Chain T, C59 Fab Light chain [Oryctolagus cuniculus]8DF1_V Chain V, C59 Fab Light chain [Oryctolagus cuniculus]
DPVLTQTPASVEVPVGGTVTINCQASQSIGKYLNWYQQKPGQPPKLLIYSSSSLASGVSSRFKGSGFGTQFTLTISGVQCADAATYYCQQGYSYVDLENGFGGGTELEILGDPVAPTVLIFPPAADQVATGTVTIVCVANKYFPDVTVTWEVDGTTQTTGIENSKTPQNSADCTYNLSSTLTLTSTQYNSHKEYTCKVTQGTTSVVQSFNRGDC